MLSSLATDHACPGLNNVTNGRWLVPDGKTPVDVTYCEWCVKKGVVDPGKNALVSDLIQQCNCDSFMVDKSTMIEKDGIAVVLWKPNLQYRYKTKGNVVEIRDGSEFYFMINCEGYFTLEINDVPMEMINGFNTVYHDTVLIPNKMTYRQFIPEITKAEWELVKTVKKYKITIQKVHRVESHHVLKSCNKYLGKHIIRQSHAVLDCEDYVNKNTFTCELPRTITPFFSIAQAMKCMSRNIYHNIGHPTVIDVTLHDSISTNAQIKRTMESSLVVAQHEQKQMSNRISKEIQLLQDQIKELQRSR